MGDWSEHPYVIAFTAQQERIGYQQTKFRVGTLHRGDCNALSRMRRLFFNRGHAMELGVEPTTLEKFAEMVAMPRNRYSGYDRYTVCQRCLPDLRVEGDSMWVREMLPRAKRGELPDPATLTIVGTEALHSGGRASGMLYAGGEQFEFAATDIAAIGKQYNYRGPDFVLVRLRNGIQLFVTLSRQPKLVEKWLRAMAKLVKAKGFPTSMNPSFEAWQDL